MNSARDDGAAFTHSSRAEPIARERARTVHAALERLPADQRDVIDLTDFSGLTQAEAAAELKVPLATVTGGARLAINRLRGSVVQLA